MNTISRMFVYLTVFCMAAQSALFQADNLVTEKRFNGKIIGGGVVLHETYFFSENNQTGKAFQIEVKKAGKYFLSCWVCPTGDDRLDFFVDNNRQITGSIPFNRKGWQASIALNSDDIGKCAVELTIGEHIIGFLGKPPVVPQVDFIRLGSELEDVAIPEDAYQKRINKLAATVDCSIKGDTALPNIVESEQKMSALLLRDDPLYKYAGFIDSTFKYTYRSTFYFTQGSNVTFECRNANIGTVVYLFNQSNPSAASWVGNYSSINVTIPVTGYYTGLVRSYWWYYGGIGDVYLNNLLYASGVPITGTLVAADLMNSGTLNYFSAKPERTSIYSNDTYIFLSTWRKDVPIAAWNDDYSGSGDYQWNRLSRIKYDLAGWYNPYNRAYIFTSTYSSYYDGVADCYLMNQNSDIMPYFPNLKADDAIKSADASGYYNCISWSGAITIEWVWPPSDSRWYVQNNPLASFDKYYNNDPLRYTGATDYPTRVAPTTTGVEVDLWATGTYPNYDYTHGSVTKPANDQMHGYDWESKPGSLTRTFHPRNALNGNSYGAVVYSYKRASAKSATYSQDNIIHMNGVALTQKAIALGITRPLTMDSSIALGLTVMRDVIFSADETKKNEALISKIPVALRNEFTTNISAWEKTWSDPKTAIFSDPQEYAKSDEYETLLKFCKSQGTAIWPLLFVKAQEHLPFIPVLLEDVLLSSAQSEMSTVKDEYSGNQFTSDGTFIYTTNNDRWVSLCKKLLMSRF